MSRGRVVWSLNATQRTAGGLRCNKPLHRSARVCFFVLLCKSGQMGQFGVVDCYVTVLRLPNEFNFNAQVEYL